MRRLRVLFLPAWYPSQVDPVAGTFTREHARAVSLYDDIVVLHAMEDDTRSGSLFSLTDEVEQGIRTLRMRHRPIPVPGISLLAKCYGMLTVYRTLVNEGYRPDVIHAHIFTAGVPAVILGLIYRTPVVVTEHYTGFSRRILSTREILKARFAMEQANLVLPVSAGLREQIETYGIHARFRVVPNTFDSELFYPSTQSRRRRRSDEKSLLLVALLTPKKGVPCLLEALHELHKVRKDFVLNIVGDGPDRAAYERMVSSLGLSGRVRFHGSKTKPEVAEYMRNCDIFVLPSLFETFGAVIIEALACGKPVIATQIDGPSEIVTDKVGCLVPAQDATELARAINYMLNHYQDYDPLRLSAYAKERYSLEAVGEQLHHIYECLLRDD